MAYDSQNIFARILRGELPCHKVYEDEHTLVFMDIMPQTDGHTLVIPREPAETIFELSEVALHACMTTARSVGEALKKVFEVEGIAIAQLNGADSGQTVPHVHFHVMPGNMMKNLKKPHATNLEDREKLADYARKISAALAN